MKAHVDDNCIGCGLCPQICPEVFEMNDQNLAVVKMESIPPALEDACRDAAASCPVEAIHILE